ncbi:acyl-CoA dehydrogenase [Streptomyces sp. 11x1]|uniref:acyl-CoA dehydrogenase family protein n=1 Tax=Streptomyces sp. 11x1 TaxID=3038642 RepID=UPI00292DDA12|nr:acyl-CoA dehydrogenase [Streptomyces sp. 11x1]WNZ06367.1 acyl-CoA dehydrogenase [Streptomyces sp. 11x1]
MVLLTAQPEEDSTASSSTAAPPQTPAGQGMRPAGEPAPGGFAPPAATTAGELTRLLFDRHGERDLVHTPWRRLIADETFRHRPGLSPAEQVEQSYQRLRLVNDTVDDAERLARDPALLASLHEWGAIVDGGGGLCTLASIHYNLFLGSLLDHAKSARRDLSPFTSMQRTGTFLCTELDHGNDSFALKTTAELDPATNEFILNTPHPGAQKFMPNTSTTGGPKTAVVAARLITAGHDHGVFLFLTPLSDETGLLPGITVHRLPLRPGAPVDHCLTSFTNVRLPRQALLEAEHGHLDDNGTLHSTLGNHRKRFLRSISRVTTGKLCMSAAAVGASRAALALAVRYGQNRHVSGPKPGQRIPVNTYRTHHSRLLDALATAYGMTLWHRTLTTRFTHPTDPDPTGTEREIAIAKAWITWQARTIVAESRERCGAHALFTANGMAGFPDYIEGTITAEGDNLVIWTKAAAELIFHTPPKPPTPPTPPTGPDQLNDTRHLRNLLSHTTTIWQTRARTALRQGPPNDPIARWNTASRPALQMTTTHAALHTADAYLHTLDHTTHPHTHTLLNHLCRLFLLNQLTPHTGDLLAHHHINTQQIHTLPTLHDTTTAHLQPHITTLTHAFDLPHPYLTAIPTTPTHTPT